MAATALLTDVPAFLDFLCLGGHIGPAGAVGGVPLAALRLRPEAGHQFVAGVQLSLVARADAEVAAALDPISARRPVQEDCHSLHAERFYSTPPQIKGDWEERDCVCCCGGSHRVCNGAVVAAAAHRGALADGRLSAQRLAQQRQRLVRLAALLPLADSYLDLGVRPVLLLQEVLHRVLVNLHNLHQVVQAGDIFTGSSGNF